MRERGGITPLPAAVALAAMLAAGCGKDAGSDHVPVKGKVTIGNAPLTKGLVIFAPDKAAGNQYPHQARGQIDEQGYYTLRSDDGNEGTPPGAYRVAVISTAPSDPKDEYAVPKSLIPTGYADPAQSGIKIEVRADAKEGQYDILLSK